MAAILGRTPESVGASAGKLKALFGFDGAVFTDLPSLLREARPDIVDVCSPAPLHFEHARQALAAGCCVLCEKPLVFDTCLPPATLLAQAEDLTGLAVSRGLRFGLCSQYAVAAATCARLVRSRESAPFERVCLELRSPARGRLPDPTQSWVDLGPHLVAALQVLFPGTEPDWHALRVQTSGYETDITLSFRPLHAPAATVRLLTGFTTGEQPANIRHMRLNATGLDLIGEAGPDGLFQMRYRSDSGLDEAQPDPMRLLIREFLAGRPVIGPDAALANQRILLRLLAAVQRAAAA